MKTSNKLTLAAILLILVSLLFYDLMLKASYQSGSYRDPFRDYVALNFKDFKSIDLNSSSAANLIVQQGPFSVRMQPNAARFVRLSRNAGTLRIDAAFPGNYENSQADYVLVISCPTLVNFNIDSRYTAGDQQITDTVASLDFKWRPTIIRGFTLDSLSITSKHAGSIILQNNNIRSLNAVIGLIEGSGSNLVISKDNHFKNANLSILNRSQLQLHAATITNLKYQVADSARVILTGAATKSLIKK
jgi:hypothetical protein